ncbi:NAD(P)-dependent dehydrogenase, short-chain alcohol dehydrogenase family [Stigmatella aurantiaca]|uniref:NAD(P)-dependent dehydrogenase, short-chain alcohol dehydrogenase family n=1 Tax=Stigmatella aurantiaca TaxID=41 RepID=A0A1H7Z3S0_STIAU|nr:glucose 1-dehydrogenase [Stigmatella aurantiaca]SEM52198.1 NAD(P)-dependent dehydrogenase, short-chain alcohol dehydrogenase family [Stigmatella aurantiaca]
MGNTLQGKVAVVTGGTSGIGLATAKRFAAEGATVFITGRRQAELDAAVKAAGPNVTGVRADMSNLADIDRLYEVVKQRQAPIDILFANAGGGEFAPLGTITEKHFDDTFATNVKGVLFTVQKALPLLRDGASILLTSSTAGIQGSAAFSVYGASKAAIRNFARSWVLDLKDRHIRVNAISPGPIKTPGLHGLAKSEEEARAMFSHMASTIPLGRLGDPDEVAKAAVFLASDASSFVNGAELFVDGGAAQI